MQKVSKRIYVVLLLMYIPKSLHTRIWQTLLVAAIIENKAIRIIDENPMWNQDRSFTVCSGITNTKTAKNLRLISKQYEHVFLLFDALRERQKYNWPLTRNTDEEPMWKSHNNYKVCSGKLNKTTAENNCIKTENWLPPTRKTDERPMWKRTHKINFDHG